MQVPSWLNKSYWFVLWGVLAVTLLSVNILRFYGLEKSPPGFHVDELAHGVTVQCMTTEGIDALDHKYPLFGDHGYGIPTPPTYMYPSIVWGKMFGFSIASLRQFTAFWAVLSILGLFMLGRSLFDWRMGLYASLAASVSPWGFQLSRLGFETFLPPFFIIWGVYFFMRSNKWYDALICGILFSGAMYSYPPTRMFLPLAFFPLLLLKWQMTGWRWRNIIMIIVSWIVVTIPLIQGTLNGAYMQRFSDIGILSHSYWQSVGKDMNIWNILSAFFENYMKHFDYAFLFTTGDTNLVYSTGHYGQLSWLDSGALGLGVFGLVALGLSSLSAKKKIQSHDIVFVAVSILVILIGISPAALTWQDLPHSLRIFGLWPFLMLLVGFVLYKYTLKWKMFWIFPALCSLVFVSSYLPHYFQEYPKNAYYMFGGFTKDKILTLESDQDWLEFAYIYRKQNFHLRYYMMNYMNGQTCTSTQEIWKHVFPL